MLFSMVGRGRGRWVGPVHARFMHSFAVLLFLVLPGAARAAPPELADLLTRGPLEEKVLGADDAPVTIVEYASMTCGHCAWYQANVLPALKRAYIDTGKVRYVVRGLATDPRGEAGLMLAYCSGSRYFAVSELLYGHQREWVLALDGRSALLKIAEKAGFSQESFEACLTDDQLLADVRVMRETGLRQFGITAVPTFFINGVKHSGAMSIGQMSAIIDGML